VNDQRIAPEWVSALEGVADPMLSSFAGVSVWASTTTFRTWPEIEPSAHEFNCRKGKSLLLGADGTMSAAEIEVTRSFRERDGMQDGLRPADAATRCGGPTCWR
jgi:hypothetical protein